MDFKKVVGDKTRVCDFLVRIWAFSLFLRIKLGRVKKFEADVIQFFAMLNSTLLYSILAEAERILVLIVIYLCFN